VAEPRLPVVIPFEKGMASYADPIMNVVLASSSPRRRDLLTEVGIRFHAICPQVEEQRQSGESAGDYVARNALTKAEWVAGRLDAEPGDRQVIIAADTIVLIQGKILEKPADRSEAKLMLTELSGRTHRVMTGVCMLHVQRSHAHECRRFVETTEVELRRLEPGDILRYIETGEPMGKAGAYAIQGRGRKFIERIRGSYSNVVGLPVERVMRVVEEWGGIVDWRPMADQRHIDSSGSSLHHSPQ